MDRHELYKAFNEAFPLEKLNDMTLEQYTNLNRSDSFCYWVESRTTQLGSFWGGSSYKFGIYKYVNKPNELDPRIVSDDNYAWYSNYNKANSKEAFEFVKSVVVEIANNARKGNLEAIDGNMFLGESYKWKIAFLYSEEKLIPIYKIDMLRVCAGALGMHNAETAKRPEIQRFLLETKGDENLYVFYDKLLAIWRENSGEYSFADLWSTIAERIKEDGYLVEKRKEKDYVWIGTKDGLIGGKSIHYEFIYRSKKVDGKRVFVEVHCEGKNADKYKVLAEIEGIHKFPWNALGLRHNVEGWKMKEYDKDELAEIVVNELYDLHSMLYDEIKALDVHYWTYAPGEQASEWANDLAHGVMSIGWNDMGDLMQYHSLEAVKDKMKAIYGDDKRYQNNGLATWQFSHEMKIGDIVYAKNGTKQVVGRGVVKSDYFYDKTLGKYFNHRKVEWTDQGEWTTTEFQMARKTLTDITPYKEMVDGIESFFKHTQYFMLVANPKIWRFEEVGMNAIQTYTARNESGNKRVTYSCFEQMKPGDLLVGFEAGKGQDFKCVLEVVEGLHLDETGAEIVSFKITKTFSTPVGIDALEAKPEFENKSLLRYHQGSIFNFSKNDFDIIMELGHAKDFVPSEQLAVDELGERVYDDYSDADFLSEVYVSEEKYKALKGLLGYKKNIILQGPPGVGKTFAAQRLAFAMMGVKDTDRVKTVQFHQNYSYEDFIMGYKPNEEGGFKLKCGVFYDFCEKARKDSRPYFFIIDEINRGNLSKIFGELMMLIEKDYRGEKHAIDLAYEKTDGMKFYVPENLYIIGMMNTADRSLAMIDYALRRRFSFFTMEPNLERLKAEGLGDIFDALLDKVKELNGKIIADPSLGRGFEIGHSFFCNLKDVDNLDERLEAIVEYEIKPTLQEYWFDNPNKVDEMVADLMSVLK